MRAVNDIYDKADFEGIKLINFKVKSLTVSVTAPWHKNVIFFLF